MKQQQEKATSHEWINDHHAKIKQDTSVLNNSYVGQITYTSHNAPWLYVLSLFWLPAFLQVNSVSQVREGWATFKDPI